MNPRANVLTWSRLLLMTTLGVSSPTAQGNAKPTQQESPTQLLAAAEKLLAAKKLDQATVRLWTARRRIGELTSPTARTELRDTVEALLKRADPLHGRGQELRQALAEDRLAVARMYRRKRWARAAAAELDRAEQLVPGCSAAERKNVQKLLDRQAKAKGAPTEPARAEGPPPLELGNQFGLWTNDGVTVTSPRFEQKGSSVYAILRNRPHADQLIAVDIALGDAQGCGAIVFGSKGDDFPYLIEVRLTGGNLLSLMFWRHADNKLVEMSQSAVTVSKFDPNKFRPFRLKIDKGRLEATYGGLVRATAKLGTDATLAGHCGYFVTGNTPSKVPVRFRGLRVEPLPEPKPKAEPARAERDRGRVEAQIAAAEAQLTEDREAAVLALRSALPRAHRLDEGPTRSALVRSITKLLDQHDPIAKKRAQRLAGQTTGIIALAKEHARQRRILSAVGWLRVGRGIDHGAMRTAYETLETEFAELFVAIRGLPPEPDQPVDLTEMQRRFAGAREEFTSGWQRGDAAWTAPKVPEQSTMLASVKPLGTHAEIRVQVKFEDLRDEAGLAFWVHSTRRFAVLTLVPAGSGRTRLALNEWLGREWRSISSCGVHLSDQALRDWITLELKYGPDTLEARVLRTDPMRLRTTTEEKGNWLPLPPTCQGQRGRVGLFAVDSRAPVHFRNLVIKETR